MDSIASDEYHETLSMVHSLSLGRKDSGSVKQDMLLPGMNVSLTDPHAFDRQVLHHRKRFVVSDLLSRRDTHNEGDTCCPSDIPQGTSVEMEVLEDIARCIRTELKSEVHYPSLLSLENSLNMYCRVFRIQST
jgi:hypothetical protein